MDLDRIDREVLDLLIAENNGDTRSCDLKFIHKRLQDLADLIGSAVARANGHGPLPFAVSPAGVLDMPPVPPPPAVTETPAPPPPEERPTEERTLRKLDRRQTDTLKLLVRILGNDWMTIKELAKLADMSEAGLRVGYTSNKEWFSVEKRGLTHFYSATEYLKLTYGSQE